jgi:hypothetical protein
MMEIKTIKDVEPSAWAEFKSIAARSGVTMGKLFTRMLRAYEEEARERWAEILKGEKILSDGEADAMLSAASKVRHEPGFR